MKNAALSPISNVRGVPLAVFVATKAELKPLSRALRPTYRSDSRVESVARVGVDGRELVLARTGMGPERAEAAGRRLFDEVPVAAAFALGVAAGLSPQLRTGDLIVGDPVFFRQRKGRAPESFPSDTRLQESALAALRRSGDRHYLGPIVTVERIILAAEEKHHLAAESGAIGVDMESAAIASAASAHGIPFLAIRAILDPVEKDLKIAFDQFLDGRGEPRPVPLFRYLVTHPLALFRLVGLGLRTNAVCARLGRLLRELSTLPS